MNDRHRQTGRTTKQLQDAYERGSVFVVHHHAMRQYAQALLVDKLGLPSNAVPIVVLSERIERDLRGTSDPVIDHAVGQCGDPEHLTLLHRVLPFVSTREA
jgi:hypothetical protein